MTRTACKKLRYLEKKNLSAVVRMIVTASAEATCAEETLAEETAIHSEWNCADRGWWNLAGSLIMRIRTSSPGMKTVIPMISDRPPATI